MSKHYARLEPSHLRYALQKVIVLLRISIREGNRTKPIAREEITEEKAATATLNALHQPIDCIYG